MMEREEMLDKVKLLLGNEVNEGVAEFALNEAEELILNYCNIEELPKGLYSTAIRIAVDIYRNESYGTLSAPSGSVVSVKIGDTSTSFGSIDDNYKQSFLKAYNKILNRFRRVVF